MGSKMASVCLSVRPSVCGQKTYSSWAALTNAFQARKTQKTSWVQYVSIHIISPRGRMAIYCQKWPFFRHRKMPKNRHFCNFSSFTDDCDGDVDLTLEFHTEDPAKYKRSASLDGQQTCFWPFLRLPKVLPSRLDGFRCRRAKKSTFWVSEG